MFENTTELIYLGIRSGMSKGNQPYQVLIVGNPQKYENYEFFIGEDIQVPPMAENEPVRVKIEMSKRGYNLVPTLKGVSKITSNVK
ncbi:hypothetical protein [Enterococcus raffinosus]|uniref:Uncharacterized protein n=1 Tax=Enterococcus raffinosus TaxID=71452 RepID=A0AAW8TC65_9ENTE|nr:hypothetical protein [Enterococcus raffinosus]MDT2525853.1 hypothetical protein [Enterococcus raffinosus]MDT2530132.1 hypothetical protein [Enterococcus raffinosus]MDT2532397.1 hypothetical protein [Enterococcus raffinosus]MDT2546916.1 hypothetical protein [Enterococcus raffinosus]MDT2576489.1 hypothetical protein [Enterococcus raffinosus]